MPHHKPIDLLRDSWKIVHRYLILYDNGSAGNWPKLIGKATARLITMAKGSIDPNLISKIVMESAMPMSRIDPNIILGKGKSAGQGTIDLEVSDLGKVLASDIYLKAVENAKENEKIKDSNK
jgi:hypothetical protein